MYQQIPSPGTSKGSGTENNIDLGMVFALGTVFVNISIQAGSFTGQFVVQISEQAQIICHAKTQTLFLDLQL